MPLHYKLFKRGMFFSHAEAGQERFACFEFCGGPNKNPAAKILSALSDMILDPETTGRGNLLALHSKYGSSVAGWPLALTTSLHGSLVLAFCGLWRLLVHFFDQYPWLLAPAFDPDVEPEEKNRCLQAFLALPKGSPQLDPGLTRKVRELVEEPEDLREGSLHDLLQAMFVRAVMTSTFVERIFRHLTGWTRSRQLLIGSVGAKHMVQQIKTAVHRWRDQEQHPNYDRLVAGVSRPAWARKRERGSRLTGYHVFQSGFTFASREAWPAWLALTHRKRSEYIARAASKRAMAKAAGRLLQLEDAQQASDPLDGPWKLSSRSGCFALNKAVVQDAMAQLGQMRNVGPLWDSKVCGKVYPDFSFPATVKYDGPWRHDVPLAHQDAVQLNLEKTRLALRFAERAEDAGVLFEFQHGRFREYVFIGHSMRLERDDFEAEMLRMEVSARREAPDFGIVVAEASGLVEGEASASESLTLQYRWSDSVPWLDVLDETKFMMALAETAAVEWDMFELSNTIVSLKSRQVTGRVKVDLSHLRELEKHRLLHEAAMRAFRLAAGLRQPREKRNNKAAGVGKGAGRGRGGARGRGERRRGPKIMAHETTDSESSQASGHVEDDDDYEIGKALHVLDPKAAAPAAAAARGKAAFRAKPGERIMEWWGGEERGFPFAFIVPGGVHTGYGVVCGRHCNADGHAAGTPCKKVIMKQDGMSEDEAKLRLKRWLMAGAIMPLTVGRERQSHIKLGGVSLKGLGSDTDWGEFDHADLDLYIQDKLLA